MLQKCNMQTKVYSFGAEEEDAGDKPNADNSHLHIAASRSQPKLSVSIQRSDTTTSKTPTIYSGPLPVQRGHGTQSVASSNPFLPLTAPQTLALRRKATTQSDHRDNRRVQRHSFHKSSQDASPPERMSSLFAPKKPRSGFPRLALQPQEEEKVTLSISEAVATVNIGSGVQPGRNADSTLPLHAHLQPPVPPDKHDEQQFHDLVAKETSGLCYACQCPIQ